MSHPSASAFHAFWEFYVREHSRPGTRLLHFWGTTLAFLVVGAAIAMQWWALLAAALVVGYGLAWIGHFTIEGNKPATFQHPLWSFLCDMKMWWLMLTGKMDAEVQRVLAAPAKK